MDAMIASTLDYLRGVAGAEAWVHVDVQALVDSMADDQVAMGHAVTVAGQAAPIDPASPPSTLVFEFPDGVRGGYGNIQGTGSRPDFAGPHFLLEQIRKCGATDARYSDVEISHRRLILASSTARDPEIVSCVTRSVPSHFSVFTTPKDSPRK